MDNALSLEALAGAEACFAVASRLLYCEPDYGEVAAQVETRQFSSAPFAAENAVAAEGLENMNRWATRVAEEAGEAGSDGAGALSLEASPVFRERVDDLRREWLRLFVGLGAPQASCLESFYVEPSGRMFAESTLAVREAYRAYGLQIERLHSEPDDHLGLMLGFLSHLIGAEIEAREAGEGDAAEKIASDQEAFLVEHVLPWLSAWRYTVEKCATSDYFRGAGDFIFGLTACYAERFGIRYNAQERRFNRRQP